MSDKPAENDRSIVMADVTRSSIFRVEGCMGKPEREAAIRDLAVARLVTQEIGIEFEAAVRAGSIQAMLNACDRLHEARQVLRRAQREFARVW